MSSIYCRYCGKEIKDRDELVTATNYFRIQPYHWRCFGKVEEETIAVTKTWKPLNGPSGTISVVLMLLLAGVMAFTDVLGEIGNLIGVLSLYPIVLRVLSYFLFESKVPDLQKQNK
ncbi:hypothetical protein GLW08_07060 [Pontibacillus yanchengensis]|uniref:Uncharacterized protein n=2 Tax=Pontibacillus yanchengensis TaxID=462910 RepID=A0ACC7VE96_9BACI|nr:hypothetical protein [Pontibacillus yanchengensis]MYL32516.1 hypothetical protein [Pontibacillus yanchengensis]MYL53097.1 hypothetical protein [Pontibacillus yanchengensis]